MNNLSKYHEISSLNENTVIVEKDGKKYVKKRVPRELTYIYKILVNNHHENVADIVDIFEYNDITVVIEEYISGEKLANIIEQNGKQTEKYTKNIIGQICDGLIFLHRHNIIHRDVNPNNIMITRDGTIKIIDFDISRSIKTNASSDTIIMGTVGYAAPEQFGFSQSDARTDLYAVGVLANVMLTGERPNTKIYKGKLGRIIAKATEMDAHMRYRNVESFKHAFTNEIDDNTNKIIKILRCVPGFRTWKIWKMLAALAVYLIYIPIMILFLLWSTSIKSAVITVLSEILMFVIPYVLLTNINGVQRILAYRKVPSILLAIIISAIAFILGASLFVLNR